MPNTASLTSSTASRQPLRPTDTSSAQVQSQMENLEVVCGEWRFPEMLVIEAYEENLSAQLNTWTGCNRVTTIPVESLGTRLPYGHQQFDAVVLSRQLHFFERPAQLLQELARVSAFQLLEVPVCDTAMLDAFAAELASQGVANIFTPSLLRFQLHRAGLEVLSDRISTRRTTGVQTTGWLSKPRFLSNKKRQMQRSYTVLTQAARPLRVVGE